MRALPFLAAFAFGPMAVPAPAAPATPAPAATVPAAPNAADVYRRAFAALPAGADLEAMVNLPEDGPLDAAALALANKYDAAAGLLKEAARVPKCEWGLDRTKGPSLLIPFASQARPASVLTAVRARAHAQQNRFKEALDECGAALVLARRVGSEPFLICKLVETGVTLQTSHAAAAILQAAPPEMVRRFEQWLAALPRSLTPAQAYEGDLTNLADWLARPENVDPEQLFAAGGPLQMPGGPAPETADLKAQWADPAARKSALASVRTIAAAGAAVLAAKPADVQRAAAAWARSVEESGTLARFLARVKPDFVRRSVMEGEVTLAMLRTAVAMRLNGPGALATSRDPAGDGPFTREAAANGDGYVLKSKAHNSDGPVTLRVGP